MGDEADERRALRARRLAHLTHPDAAAARPLAVPLELPRPGPDVTLQPGPLPPQPGHVGRRRRVALAGAQLLLAASQLAEQPGGALVGGRADPGQPRGDRPAALDGREQPGGAARLLGHVEADPGQRDAVHGAGGAQVERAEPVGPRAEVVEPLPHLAGGPGPLAATERRQRPHLPRLQPGLQRVGGEDRREARGDLVGVPARAELALDGEQRSRPRQVAAPLPAAGGLELAGPTRHHAEPRGPGLRHRAALAAQHQHLRLALPQRVAPSAEGALGPPRQRQCLADVVLDERALGVSELRLGHVLTQPALREEVGGPGQQRRRLRGEPRLAQHPGLVEQRDRVRVALPQGGGALHDGQRPRDATGQELDVPEVVPGLLLVLAVPDQRGDLDAVLEVARATSSDPRSMWAVPRLSRITIWSSGSASSITSTAASRAAIAWSTRPPRSSSSPRWPRTVATSAGEPERPASSSASASEVVDASNRPVSSNSAAASVSIIRARGTSVSGPGSPARSSRPRRARSRAAARAGWPRR